MSINKIIDVIAPSSGKNADLLSTIDQFIATLGYKARIPKDIIKANASLFCANTDETRYQHLIDALIAQDSEIIWAWRGGYGATRLIRMLQESKPPITQKKLLIGFSDITALFLYFYKQYKWPYIHGRVLSQYFMQNIQEEEIAYMRYILEGNYKNIQYHFTPFNKHALKDTSINTEIIGGNLSMIQCSIGTTWQIDTQNKILFIEEINELGYRVHRTLEHLKQVGIFDNICALILGDISYNLNDNTSLCEEAINDFFKGAHFPIIRNTNFGHGKNNFPLIMGIESTLKLGNKISLTF